MPSSTIPQSYNSPAAALLNSTGLSLGYFYLRRFRRGGLHLLITLVLLLGAYTTPQLHIALPALILIAAWLAWMTFDGWQQAKKAAPPAPIPAWAALLAGGVMLIFSLSNIFSYLNTAREIYNNGAQAYAESNYPLAHEALTSFTRSYHLSLNENLPNAEKLVVECAALQQAQTLAQAGDYPASIQAYQAYLNDYPQSAKIEETNAAIAQNNLDWAMALAEQGDYAAALEKFQTLFTDYPQSPAASLGQPQRVETRLNYAAQLEAQSEHALALAQYELVLNDPFAEQTFLTTAYNGAAQAHFNLAAELINAKDYQKASQELESLLQNYPSAPNAAEAAATAAQTWMDWGDQLAQEKNYTQALVCYQTLLKDFPKSSQAAEAKTRAAQVHLTLGDIALQAGDFESAAQHFDTILTIYKSSAQAADARLKEAEAYWKWGQNLASKSNYTQALMKYDWLFSTFPDTPASLQARAESGAVRLQAADMYRNSQKFAQAENQYNLLTTTYADLPEAALALKALPGLYIAWAQDLASAGRYSTAIAHLETMSKKFPKEDALSQMVDIYIAWGSSLVQKGSFLEAMEMLDEAKGQFVQSALKKKVADAYQQAVIGLSEDTGKEGSDLLAEAISKSCAGEGFDSPAVGISKEHKHAFPCDYSIIIDSDYVAHVPAELYYTFYTQSGESTLESCTYTGSHTLIRQRSWMTVTLRSVRSGYTYVSQTFYGSSPMACPQYYSFSSSVNYLSGDAVDFFAVQDWIESKLLP